jgi:pyridoxine 5-phosphate synthase
MSREECCIDFVSPEALKIRHSQSNSGSQYHKNERTRDFIEQTRISNARSYPKVIHLPSGGRFGRQNAVMLKLGVNIDHVATLREARYRGRERGEPDPVAAAVACEAAGAHGITCHLREDRRHILDRDVWRLRESVKTRLNLELANSAEIVAIALKVKPEIVCLVPERRQEVTTEGGLDVVGNERALAETRQRMNEAGIEVSLFIGPDAAQIEASARIGAQFIELHTGSFAEAFEDSAGREPELQRLITGAKQAHELGLKVNAGHGLNYENLRTLHRVPHLIELNIGHSIVSRAITVGITSAVKEMLELMKGYAD